MKNPLSRVRHLDMDRLEEERAHGGEGRIGVHRVFTATDFEGPWNFIDHAVLPPDCSIGLHKHGDNEELYFILEGNGSMQLDGKEFGVGPGTLVLNRRDGSHGLKNTGSEPLRLLVVEVAIDPDRRTT